MCSLYFVNGKNKQKNKTVTKLAKICFKTQLKNNFSNNPIRAGGGPYGPPLYTFANNFLLINRGKLKFGNFS